MAATVDAKKALWRALGALRRKQWSTVEHELKQAILFLEMGRDVLDPGLKRPS